MGPDILLTPFNEWTFNMWKSLNTKEWMKRESRTPEGFVHMKTIEEMEEYL